MIVFLFSLKYAIMIVRQEYISEWIGYIEKY